MEKRLPRKLAAILYADVVGYSRLSGEDEDATYRRLREYLDLMAATIKAHGGRVVHYAGDAVLAEFGAAVDALSCAASIQIGLETRNEDLPDGRKVRFRVGVNLGDVIEDRGDIYGDGVNVAARLQNLAEPGGICVSDAVRNAVGTKLPIDFEYLGEQQVKNIKEPVRAYHVRPEPGADLPAIAGGVKTPWRVPRTIAAAILAALVIGVGVFIGLKFQEAKDAPPSTGQPASQVSRKPSIAVLPFKNMSAEAQQGYFADGMTDDLITDLSGISGVLVISRNSVFAYKDKPVEARQVAKELGVRYVLQGSVRRAGGKIRINAQLVDGLSGGHLWAGRYDGDGTDVFALQDRVIGSIVSALAVSLTDTERDQLARIPTGNLEAYDYYLRAKRGLYGWSSEGRREALNFYYKAVALDPRFADAYAGIAMAASDVWRSDEADVLPGPVARKLAYEAAGKALALDSGNARAYSVLAYAQMVDGRHNEALESVQKAVSSRPNDADVYVDLANVLVYAGQHAEALAAMETAFRLQPKPPAVYYGDLGWVLFWNHRYEEAIGPLRKAIEGGVDRFATLAMTYAELGRLEQARAVVDRALALFPEANLAYYRLLHAHHKRPEDLERRLGALRKAGMPEWPFGYQARAEDRLDAAAIEALTFGRTWVGHDAEGKPFIQQISKDGKIALRSPDSLLTGTTWLEGDTLCNHFPAIRLARKSCGYLLFRNPGGTLEKQNEYVEVSAGGILYFSTKP